MNVAAASQAFDGPVMSINSQAMNLHLSLIGLDAYVIFFGRRLLHIDGRVTNINVCVIYYDEYIILLDGYVVV